MTAATRAGAAPGWRATVGGAVAEIAPAALRLPAPAIEGLADLVQAGYPLAQALEALPLLYAGILGRHGWRAPLQNVTLFLPFLRGYAIHGCNARLLETLAREQPAATAVGDSLQRREPAPLLANDLAPVGSGR